MSLPIKIATALKLRLLMDGESIPYSQVKDDLFDVLIQEGLIQRKLQGKSKSLLFVINADSLSAYLKNQFNIPVLTDYIEAIENEDLSRSAAIEAGSNSKLKTIRTFKGFLVNCYSPINATLNVEPFIINPVAGSFNFIYDYESFIPAPEVTIVGIENSENFRHIEKQQQYFKNIKPLFVSRYPQGKDIVKWLTSIPNPYLHFGDFDFEGINIYFNEYKKHLGERASFFIPEHIEQLLQLYGNSELYDKQFNRRPDANDIAEEKIKTLVNLINTHKKVLEQEILISK